MVTKMNANLYQKSFTYSGDQVIIWFIMIANVSNALLNCVVHKNLHKPLMTSNKKLHQHL